jgi:hypothetical protein
MFKSIKGPLMLIVFVTILFVSVFSIVLSIIEHEKLYRESVKQDLDGLSENLSNDLVTILATAGNDIELTTILLRLDRYENVKFAHIFSVNNELLSSYFGKQADAENSMNKPQLADVLKNFPLGMSIAQKQLVAFKVIGDKRLPQGYLPEKTTRNQYVSYVLQYFSLNRVDCFTGFADFIFLFKSLVSTLKSFVDFC